MREQPVCRAVHVVGVGLQRLLAQPRRRARRLAKPLSKLAPSFLRQDALALPLGGCRVAAWRRRGPRLRRRLDLLLLGEGGEVGHRRRHARERLDVARAAVRRVPPVLLVVDGDALLVELVAQPVGRLVVVPQPRRLPAGEDLAHVLVGEGRHDDRARAAVRGVPLVRVEVHAVLLQLLAQHVRRLVVAARARLLALHEDLLNLLDGQLRRPRARRLLRVRRRDVHRADRPRAPVRRLPLVLLGVEVHAVLFQLVA
mmetsp:Transcript_7372/g.16232  ORF Transcript_7372/g.16232 Transcript_7372/m.16232 type:complete len:256 (+) Transcript_7372:3501-4268(+)